MVDSAIWFAKPQFDHTAERPARRQVRINQQRSVKEGSAIIKISDYIGERVSGEAQYGRIVFAQLHSASREPPSFSNLLCSVDNPARRLAPVKTHRGCGISRRKISIKFDSFVKQAKRFVSPVPGPFVEICQSAQKQVVGVETFGWFAPGPFDFYLFEPRRDCAHHTCGHSVLQLENILDGPFEAIRPEVCSR